MGKGLPGLFPIGRKVLVLPRLLRTSFWTGFLLTAFAATLLSAPTVWYWISTEPEPKFANMVVLGADVEGEVRVLKWGDNAGLRHGKFYKEWDDRQLYGEYDCGEYSGVWREVDRSSRNVLIEAVPIRFEEQSDDFEPVTLLGREVRLSHSDYAECAIDGLSLPISLNGDFLMARETDEGCWISGASIDDEGIAIEHPGVVLRPNGSVAFILNEEIRTDYEEENVIVRQALWLDGEERQVRTEPPWFHPVTGEEEWLTEPVGSSP